MAQQHAQTERVSTINVIVMMALEDVTASFPTRTNVNTDLAMSLRIAQTPWEVLLVLAFLATSEMVFIVRTSMSVKIHR